MRLRKVDYMKKKIILSLTMFMILGISNGLSNINEVKAVDERIIIMNPSYGLGYSVNLAKDECIDIDKLNNNVLNPASLTQTSTTLNTSSTVVKHSNDFNDLAEQLESYYGISSTCSTPDYSLFTATVASKYQDLTRMDYTSFPYQYDLGLPTQYSTLRVLLVLHLLENNLYKVLRHRCHNHQDEPLFPNNHKLFCVYKYHSTFS